MSQLPLATLLENLPSSVRTETVKLLEKMGTALDPMALIDLLGDLSTKGEIPIPLNRLNKKAEKECFQAMKKKCLGKVQRMITTSTGAGAGKEAALATLTVPQWADAFLGMIDLACCLQHNVLLPLSGKLVGPIIETLPDDMVLEGEEEHSTRAPTALKAKFQDCQGLIVEMLNTRTVDLDGVGVLVKLKEELVAWTLAEGEE